MPARRLTLAALVVAAVLAGCDDDDEGPPAPAPAPTTEAAPPAPTDTEAGEPRGEPREERTLTGCLRAAGAEEVLVKGRDNEDARYFQELVGAKVTALAITLEGEPAELDAFLFASAADARKAAPGAGAAGLTVSVHGRAVLVAPAGAETATIESCLEEAG